jgi:hypothetical protein
MGKEVLVGGVTRPGPRRVDIVVVVKHSASEAVN